MRTIPRLLTTLGVALTLAIGATAQVTKIPNSGCPSAPYPAVSGNPTIGTKFSVGCPPTIDRMQVLVGLRQPNPLVIGTPIMCVNNCSLDLVPLFVTRGASWDVGIPNDPNLIGAAVVAQCLQSSLNRTCLLLTGALDIVVM